MSSYYRYIYENDAFHKVIRDINSNGITLSVGESEGFTDNGGSFICDSN